MGLVYIALSALLLLALCIIYTEITIYIARKDGRYPGKGQVTMADVQNLVLSGDRILAMRAYRELTGSSLKKAKAVVEEMTKSITRTK